MEGGIVTSKILKTKNGYGYISNLTPFDAMIHNLPLAEVQRCFGKCAYQLIIPLAQKLESYQLKLHEIKDGAILKDDDNYKAICADLSSMFDSTLAARFRDGNTLKLDHLSIGNVNSDLFESKECLMTSEAREIRGFGLRQIMAKRNRILYLGLKPCRY